MECGHVRSCRQKRPWCWPYYTIHMMAMVLTCLCQRVQLLYLSASIFLFYLHNVFIWALRRTILLAKHIFQWHLVQFTNTIEILLNTEHNRRLIAHITGEGGWTDHNSDISVYIQIRKPQYIPNHPCLPCIVCSNVKIDEEACTDMCARNS